MTSCGFKALIDLEALLPRKRLTGYISDGHLGLTSTLAEVWEIQKLCWESARPQSCLPHLLLAKLACHSTMKKKPDWRDVKPRAAFPSPVSGQDTTGQCCLATPIALVWSPVGKQLLVSVLFPFFAEWQFKCNNCKIILLAEEIVCKYSPKQI